MEPLLEEGVVPLGHESTAPGAGINEFWKADTPALDKGIDISIPIMTCRRVATWLEKLHV